MKKVFDGYGDNSCVIISVDFNDGGQNWYTGNTEKKGYWCYFSVGKRTEFGSIRVKPQESNNFKFILVPLNRRNKNKQKKLFDLISKREYADMVWAGEKNKLYEALIKLI